MGVAGRGRESSAPQSHPGTQLKEASPSCKLHHLGKRSLSIPWTRGERDVIITHGLVSSAGSHVPVISVHASLATTGHMTCPREAVFMCTEWEANATCGSINFHTTFHAVAAVPSSRRKFRDIKICAS